MLIGATLLTWIPLLGRSLPVADDFGLMQLVSHGGIHGYIRSLGFWRPIGQYLPIYALLRDPRYHPILVISTHLLVVVLFYHLCASLFGGVKLPLVAALLFATSPFGFEAMTWVITYNYVIPVLFFVTNLLLLAKHEASSWPTIVLFGISALLALLTALSNECLFFASACSGTIAFVSSSTGNFRSDKFIKRSSLLALAPAVGCALWIGLFFGFKGSEPVKQVAALHPLSILSVWCRQYSLLDVFVPWFSPVTRALVFVGWNRLTAVSIVSCAGLSLVCLWRLCGRRGGLVELPRKAAPFTLAAILALLFGGSLIYVVGGGFSLDSRKKYPLFLLLLLLACWLYRALAGRRRVLRNALLVWATFACISGVLTSWLVVGIWKQQTREYNALADFLVSRQVRGGISVKWNPDLRNAWPQLPRVLGYYFDDSLVLNGAVRYRGGGPVTVLASGPSVVEYRGAGSGWTLRSPGK
jgi:hypothetical protein